MPPTGVVVLHPVPATGSCPSQVSGIICKRSLDEWIPVQHETGIDLYGGDTTPLDQRVVAQESRTFDAHPTATGSQPESVCASSGAGWRQGVVGCGRWVAGRGRPVW